MYQEMAASCRLPIYVYNILLRYVCKGHINPCQLSDVWIRTIDLVKIVSDNKVLRYMVPNHRNQLLTQTKFDWIIVPRYIGFIIQQNTPPGDVACIILVIAGRAESLCKLSATACILVWLGDIWSIIIAGRKLHTNCSQISVSLCRDTVVNQFLLSDKTYFFTIAKLFLANGIIESTLWISMT